MLIHVCYQTFFVTVAQYTKVTVITIVRWQS